MIVQGLLQFLLYTRKPVSKSGFGYSAMMENHKLSESHKTVIETLPEDYDISKYDNTCDHQSSSTTSVSEHQRSPQVHYATYTQAECKDVSQHKLYNEWPSAQACVDFLTEHFMFPQIRSPYCDKTWFKHIDIIVQYISEAVNKITTDVEVVIAGSVFEGTCIPYINKTMDTLPVQEAVADIDFLFVQKYYICAEDDVEIPHAPFITMPGSSPGFVRLKVIEDVFQDLQNQGHFCVFNDYCYDANDGKMYLLHKLSKFATTDMYELHGPSLRTVENDMDYTIQQDHVYALPLPNWPTVSAEWWQQRDRNWPSATLVKNVMTTGCHIVAKSSDVKNNSEWRLSFSKVEAELARSLSVVQRKCYMIVKCLLKNGKEKPIPVSTYHMKTAFFWLLEETQPHRWREDNVAECVFAILDKLARYLGLKNLPHYFIPECNLLDSLEEDTVKTCVIELQSLLTNMIPAMKYCYNSLSVIGGRGSSFDEVFAPVLGDMTSLAINNKVQTFRNISNVFLLHVSPVADATWLSEDSRELIQYADHYWHMAESLLAEDTTYHMTHTSNVSHNMLQCVTEGYWNAIADDKLTSNKNVADVHTYSEDECNTKHNSWHYISDIVYTIRSSCKVVHTLCSIFYNNELQRDTFSDHTAAYLYTLYIPFVDHELKYDQTVRQWNNIIINNLINSQIMYLNDTAHYKSTTSSYVKYLPLNLTVDNQNELCVHRQSLGDKHVTLKCSCYGVLCLTMHKGPGFYLDDHHGHIQIVLIINTVQDPAINLFFVLFLIVYFHSIINDPMYQTNITIQSKRLAYNIIIWLSLVCLTKSAKGHGNMDFLFFLFNTDNRLCNHYCYCTSPSSNKKIDYTIMDMWYEYNIKSIDCDTINKIKDINCELD